MNKNYIKKQLTISLKDRKNFKYLLSIIKGNLILIKYFIILFAIILITNNVVSQNFFYNTQQFGLRSSMLGGAVTSGNEDLSMAYYNPAALHLAKAKADISLVQPRFEIINFENYFGSEASNLNTDVILVPRLTSIKLNWGHKINLVIITIQKSNWNELIQTQSILEQDGVFNEQIFKYHYSGNDRWVGLGGSYKINKHFAFGLSQFFSSANFISNRTLQYNVVDAVTTQSISNFSDVLISSWKNTPSLVTKLGLHINYSHNSFGLVVKTPNYLILSKSGSYERSITDISVNGSSSSTVIDYDIAPIVKTPWEFNLGYAYALKNHSKLWLNVAHYTKVSEYNLATIKPGYGETINWKNENKKVTNFSIGLSTIIRPQLELNTSFRTNYSAYKNKTRSSGEEGLFILDHDRFHFTFGGSFNFRNNLVTLGLDYGFSRIDNDTLFSDYPNIQKFKTNESTFHSNSFTFLITYGFIKKRK